MTPSRAWLSLALLCFGCSQPPAPSAPDAGAPFSAPVTLTVIITGHESGYLLPDEGGIGGAARALGLWRSREGHCAGKLPPSGDGACADASTLVLSTGDNWNGSPISNHFAGANTAEVMGRMGYGASALGNFELAFGRPQFHLNQKLGGFPYLAANLAVEAESGHELALPSFKIFERKGIKLAVIGLTGEQAVSRSMPGRFEGLRVNKYEPAIAEALPKVRALGARAVIVVGDVCLTEMLPVVAAHPEWKLDLVAGNGCGKAVPTPIGGTYLYEPGPKFTNYLSAKFTFENEALKKIEPKLVEVAAATEPDPELSELIAGWKTKLDAALGEEIGFSHGLDETATQNWVARALKEQLSADVAVINRKGVRTVLPAGKITHASVYEVIPFENSVVVMHLSGAQVKEALKNPAAIAFGPATLDEKKSYRVATTEFSYFGGDGFEFEKWDTTPQFNAMVWQTPVIEWTKRQATTAKAPLEKKLK